MKIQQLIIRPNTTFSKRVSEWAVENNIECLEVQLEDDFEEHIDGLVIFNQNQDMEREALDIRKLFDDRQKPVQRIDINGTLMVGVSNFSLWIERNGCKRILMIGADKLCENPNLERYLSHMKAN